MKKERHKVRTIRIADDIAIFDESREQLVKTLKRMESKLNAKFKIGMNRNKTKVYDDKQIEKQDSINIKIERERFKKVKEFKYLR